MITRLSGSGKVPRFLRLALLGGAGLVVDSARCSRDRRELALDRHQLVAVVDW